MKKLCSISLLVVLLLFSACKDSKSVKPILSGPYLGQELPGDEPVLFAPGIVSTGMYDRDITITPDGKEIYFGIMVGTYVTILYCKEAEGVWSNPEVAGFARNPEYFYFEPHVTPDGQHLMFLSTMPPPGEEPIPGWGHQHIWIVDRSENGYWSEPYLAGAPITTSDNDYFPSVTLDGTLYFTKSLKSNPRLSQIYRSRSINGKYQEPERLPDIINKSSGVYNSFIAPDETYLITCSANQDSVQTKGFADYYIFYRNKNDVWSEGINLGSLVNAPNDAALSPYVSPDGKYFFFSSSRLAGNMADSSLQISAKMIEELYYSPGNGNSDTYWMSSGFIKKLKPKDF
ncbi:MAG: hypothetical protein KKA84_12375 [Bacteroidetes bacterium]|nr:hypothetical protein [Bacteroidota bacterium]